MTDLAGLISEVRGELAPVFEAMERAEDEIAQAARRHPVMADVLFHCFALIQPGAGMGIEFVYRGHARELLERAAAGHDLRPGTAAEVCLLWARTSQLAPFHTAAVGLYMRMWMAAFPGHPVHDAQTADQIHYEALRAGQIDDLERETRRRLAVPARQLTGITCGGIHHGAPVNCRYHTTPTGSERIPRPRPAGPAEQLDLFV